ncbi:MAG: glutathione peroxidase [Chitinophagaceae bacterium]
MNKFIKYFAIGIATFIAYVLFDNRNTTNLSFRQKVLKTLYPAILFFSKLTGSKSSIKKNDSKMQPSTSFYTLNDTLNNGTIFNFDSLKGKKVLIVNTASNCGYTNQYEALQTLHQQYGNKLVVIGFPSNDFKEQEKGNDDEIASFCKINYGVTFLLMKKSGVLKNSQQNKVFQWLTSIEQNGWNDAPPTWNFNKYLINEQGILTHVFEPGISPLDTEVVESITK